MPSLPFDVLLTTYDIALIDQEFLSQVPWHYTIIDEAQRLKNTSSVCSKFLATFLAFHILFRICVTGLEMSTYPNLTHHVRVNINVVVQYPCAFWAVLVERILPSRDGNGMSLDWRTLHLLRSSHHT